MKPNHIAPLTGVVLLALAAHASAAGLPGDSWDSIKQLPDFSGVWQSTNVAPGAVAKGKMVVTPAWQKKLDALAAVRKKSGDVEGRAKYCIYLGFPGGMAGPEEVHEFLYTPGQVTMTDVQGYVRRIYTDGRKHHVGPPTFWGDSVGHWEGNALVVDTVGLQAGNEIAYGLPGGPDMHVVERIYLKDDDPNIMVIDEVIESPKAFLVPYRFTTLYQRHPDWPMTEWDCAQNNRDLTNEGKQQMDLNAPEAGPHIAPKIPDHTRGSHKNDGVD